MSCSHFFYMLVTIMLEMQWVKILPHQKMVEIISEIK